VVTGTISTVSAVSCAKAPNTRRTMLPLILLCFRNKKDREV
jgi:hypothetical protein